MPEYYSEIVTSINYVNVNFSEMSKFQLEIDYTDENPVHVSKNLIFSVVLKLENYPELDPTENDIFFEYQDNGEWINALSLTNPGISMQLNNINEGIYNIIFTIDSEITRSSQGWINSIFNKNFRLRVSDNFIQQIENKGYTTFQFEDIFYAFEVDISKTQIWEQPQDVIHHPIDGSNFTAKYVYYDKIETAKDWQYSDNYDSENPDSANWEDMNAFDVNSEGTSVSVNSVNGDLSSLMPGVNQGDPNAPTFTSSTVTLTVNNWVPRRKYRYRYVVV